MEKCWPSKIFLLLSPSFSLFLILSGLFLSFLPRSLYFFVFFFLSHLSSSLLSLFKWTNFTADKHNKPIPDWVVIKWRKGWHITRKSLLNVDIHIILLEKCEKMKGGWGRGDETGDVATYRFKNTLISRLYKWWNMDEVLKRVFSPAFYEQWTCSFDITHTDFRNYAFLLVSSFYEIVNKQASVISVFSSVLAWKQTFDFFQEFCSERRMPFT